jgi:hypothetical protein
MPSDQTSPLHSQQSNVHHIPTTVSSQSELGSNKKQKLTDDISLSTTNSSEEIDSNSIILNVDQNQFQIYDSLLFDSKDNKENKEIPEKRNMRRKSSAPKEKIAKGTRNLKVHKTFIDNY